MYRMIPTFSPERQSIRDVVEDLKRMKKVKIVIMDIKTGSQMEVSKKIGK